MESSLPQKIVINTLTNAIDSLETASQSLDRNDPMKWKWFAFAIHHSLYQFCCRALHNGNYETLLKLGNKPDDGNLLKIGQSENLLESKTRKVRENKPAYLIEWVSTDKKFNENPSKKRKSNNKELLISFWSALARVQDSVFWMHRLSTTKAISLSESEWDSVIWLTNELRNKIQHFIPKTYILVDLDFIEPGIDFVNIIKRLVFDTHAISLPGEYEDRTEGTISDLLRKLNA